MLGCRVITVKTAAIFPFFDLPERFTQLLERYKNFLTNHPYAFKVVMSICL